jgi:hypothetical protein
MTISALEVATSLLLETDYGLGMSSVGCVVGITFVAGLPLIMFLDSARRSGYASFETILLVTTAACVVATPLLFKPVGMFVSQGLKVQRCLPLIIADAVIFPAAYAVSGIIDGMAMKWSVAGTYFSQENYLMVMGLLQSLVRFIGPPLARHLVAIGGQNAYACFQAIVLGLALLEAISIVQSSID